VSPRESIAEVESSPLELNFVRASTIIDGHAVEIIAGMVWSLTGSGSTGASSLLFWMCA
jgi:hypothetical protein